MFAELPEENVGATFGSGDKYCESAFWLLRDRKIYDYFDVFQTFQLFKAAIADHQTCDVHSSAISIVAFVNFTHCPIIDLRCQYNPFRPNRLRYQCFFCQ